MAPQRALFRQEAIEFQRYPRQWGEVALLQPPSSKLLAWLLTVAVALVIVFLSLAQFARKETVAGYLTPVAGTAKIVAPRAGTVQAVDVEQGQRVHEGQPLLTIATHEVAADGEEINAAKLDALTRQKDLLVRQITAEEQRTSSERERLTALTRGLENEIAQLKTQISFQSERARLAKSLAAATARLSSNGHASDFERKRQQAVALEQEQNLGALGQQLDARENQLTQTRYSLEQLPTVMAEKIQLLRNDLSDAEQRIAEAKGRRAYVMRSPISGRVSTVQASVGGTANPRDFLLEIVPTDGALQAELFVPTRAIGFVRTGQRVRILYDAFPYQKFGAYAGRIIKASQTILTGSDVSGPVVLKEPAYRITVALDRPDVDAYGNKMPLQAGMLLRADIILDRRSVMHWLIEPLLGART